MQTHESLWSILLTLITSLICLKCSNEDSWLWWCNTSLLSEENLCHCGNVTIDFYPYGATICLDSSTCEVDTLGNVTCPNGIVGIEPVFIGGRCNVHDQYTISVPCQEESGEIICSDDLNPAQVCKGFPYWQETACIE